MTLQQLRYFCEVVRQNMNISQAAAALHITQPGLSRQLRLLEEELKVGLFVRNRTRLVRLSDAGAEPGADCARSARRASILLIVRSPSGRRPCWRGREGGSGARARISWSIVSSCNSSMAAHTLESADNIKKAAGEHATQHEGTLTIATTHTQARYALPGVLRRFKQRYPQVQLSLRQGTPAEVSYLVASGNADLSIATEPLELPAAMLMLPCHPLQRVVLVPAGHPLLKTRRLTLEKLAEYPLITYDYGFIGHSKTLSAFKAKGIQPHIALNAIDADVIKVRVHKTRGARTCVGSANDARKPGRIGQTGGGGRRTGRTRR